MPPAHLLSSSFLHGKKCWVRKNEAIVAVLRQFAIEVATSACKGRWVLIVWVFFLTSSQGPVVTNKPYYDYSPLQPPFSPAHRLRSPFLLDLRIELCCRWACVWPVSKLLFWKSRISWIALGHGLLPHFIWYSLDPWWDQLLSLPYSHADQVLWDNAGTVSPVLGSARLPAHVLGPALAVPWHKKCSFPFPISYGI